MNVNDHVVNWRTYDGRAYIDAADLLAAMDREIVVANQELRTAEGEKRTRTAAMIVVMERWRGIIWEGRNNLLAKAGLL